MPMTNIVILLFILAMAYFGTVYGLFSAFMHLLVVIAVGAMTFALWEPITLGLLMGYVPLIAWTLGLIVPFGVLLLVCRMVVDKLVPRDAQFMSLVNTLLGAFCGILSGILTSGIVIIGLGFMPFTADLGGFQPYTIGGGGVVMERGEGDLWIPVHRITANFYSGLSAGAFATSTPMALYMPKLEEQMVTVRMRPDGVSTVAAPNAVKVTGAAVAEAKALTEANADPAVVQALGADFNRPGYKLVLIDTEWEKVEGTSDGDRAIRLPATQVRLVTMDDTDGREVIDLVGPIGFSKSQGDSRVFYPYDSDAVMAFSTAPNSSFTFAFLVPNGADASSLVIRKLRLNLPEGEDIKTVAGEVLASLGSPAVPEPEGEDGPNSTGTTANNNTGQTTVSDRNGMRAGTFVLGLDITNKLPGGAVSKNASTGLSYEDSDAGALIVTGSTGSARKTQGNVGQRSKVIGFNIPSHEAMVRVRIEPDQAVSLFGSARASAAALNPIFLEDTNGNKWFVSAWVWLKDNKDQEIHYDAFQTVRSAKELPISQMNKGDEFYLYFTVTKPVSLTSYNIGEVTDQQFEPPLDVN